MTWVFEGFCSHFSTLFLYWVILLHSLFAVFTSISQKVSFPILFCESIVSSCYFVIRVWYTVLLLASRCLHQCRECSTGAVLAGKMWACWRSGKGKRCAILSDTCGHKIWRPWASVDTLWLYIVLWLCKLSGYCLAVGGGQTDVFCWSSSCWHAASHRSV